MLPCDICSHKRIGRLVWNCQASEIVKGGKTWLQQQRQHQTDPSPQARA
jgi:hypothetical protein